MKNYGDVCLINGCKVEAVDCVIGGSPCQNLSVAGNRKGLEGSESRLFLEQMRVVKEMRQATGFQKPRYMVWENVIGSLSCNKGKDFQCVLNECVETALLGKINLNKGTKDGEENLTEEDRDGRETGIPDVPMPKDGKWPKSGILYDDMGRWSIAWRVHDAQYWGVAQRRRRIALVCDFGGMSAPEVLFESKSVSGDFNPCNAQGEGVAETSVECITEPDKVWDARGNGNGNLCSTLTGGHDNSITDYTNVIVQKVDPYLLENNQDLSTATNNGRCSTSQSSRVLGDGYEPMFTEEYYSIKVEPHESGGSIMSEVSHALKATTKESVSVKQSADDIASSAFYPCICIGNGQSHVTEHYTEEVSQTLNCMHDPMTVLVPCAYQLVGVNSNSMKSSNPNSGCYETEQAGTITTNGCVPNNQGGTAIMEPVSATKVHCICSYLRNCMKSSNPHSGVYEAETSRTLDTVSCGNPVCCQGGMAVVEPVIPFEGNGCRDSHKGDGWSTEQVSYTLNTVERHGVAYGETELSDPQAVEQPVHYLVRRLTPLECTRLQGYPDGWVDIGDWIDSKGKKHKEADAPKYKALGNSIALPFWKWLCHNIVNRLKKDGQTTTMASLFDGIGGFPLCWIEATQEKSDVLWISEIEEFPIAVTRHHFS